MAYTEEQLNEAKELVDILEAFNNKYLGIATNTKRVSDKTRGAVIAALLVDEYGTQILGTKVFNPFGKDTLTTTFRNPNSSAQ